MSKGSAALLDTELKQYTIKPESWEDFLGVWRKLIPIRKRFGFTVLFALVDKERNIFTWALSHPDDYDAADKSYQADPERIALEVIGKYVTGADMTKVTQLTIP